MSVDLSTIPSENREDFLQRLQTYGLDTSSVQEPLFVTPSAKVTLAHGPGRESARAPFVFRTTDLTQVKRMIGVDDRLYRNVASKTPLPGTISLGARTVAGRGPGLRDPDRTTFHAGPGMSRDPGTTESTAPSDEQLLQLDTEDLDNIRIAARAYVRGDSKLVSSYSPLFERAFGTITVPIWPLLSVTVAAGSVLEFGPGVNALVAYQVNVEEGGRIVSRGHLTINCTQFNKPGRFRLRPAVTALTSTAFRPIFSE